MLDKHKKYIVEKGIDMPEVTEFKWNGDDQSDL